MPSSQVYNIDCMQYMATVPDGYFDIAIVDPPYGLPSKSTQGSGKLKGRALNRGNISAWDVAPSEEYFAELRRVSKHQIVWGGNYFPLPPTRCFVCWDKQQPWENFSQCEFAWTSYDLPSKIFRFDKISPCFPHPPGSSNDFTTNAYGISSTPCAQQSLSMGASITFTACA